MTFDLAVWRAAAIAGMGKTWAADARMVGPTTNCTVLVANILRSVYLPFNWDDPDIHADMMVRPERPWSALERLVSMGLAEWADPEDPQDGWHVTQLWRILTPLRDGHLVLDRVEPTGRWRVQSARSTSRWATWEPERSIQTWGTAKSVRLL